ncbi:hypothetical protein, partial [Enterobacter cloacae]|uniref:hypothetical protein n=1 Tax=Enterobacter cloacae TaxID=550 RepID=UPI001953E609
REKCLRGITVSTIDNNINKLALFVVGPCKRSAAGRGAHLARYQQPEPSAYAGFLVFSGQATNRNIMP